MAREVRNWLINNLLEEALFSSAAQYLRGRLIDIGCGTKPYGKKLASLVSEHVGVDHAGTQHDSSKVDLFGTAYSIPVEDCSFDSAICTAVLEHLEEPELALRECHRVLKPGGVAIYAAPFIWHLHEEPRDFYRYSTYGLRYLFNKAGFEIIEIRPLSGFWVTFGQMFAYYIYRFNRGPLRWLRVIDAFAWLVQAFAYCADKIDRAEGWTWMYLVVARKHGASL
jgi:ubiquinone/menaquinone biosynthesis C-methylase UbiE